jgi:hypothetical protein
MSVIKSTDVTDETVIQVAKGLLETSQASEKEIKEQETLQQQLLLSTDKHLIQLKHCSKQIADRVLLLFNSTAIFSGKRLKLACLIAAFWASPNLNRIASSR